MSSHSDSELRIKNKPKKCTHVSFKAKERLNKEHTLNAFKSALKSTPSLSLKERQFLTAVSTNNTELVHYMLKNKVDPNVVDQQQRSALHLAVSRGYTDVVHLLLEYQAEVNVRDIIGNTPLHLAACTSNMQIISLLLCAGANIKSLDLHGRSPLQLAESKLQILRRNWKSGTIEMMQLREQLQQIVDVMISVWARTNTSADSPWEYDKLEMIKLSIKSGSENEVDDQMSKLQMQLKEFTLK